MRLLETAILLLVIAALVPVIVIVPAILLQLASAKAPANVSATGIVWILPLPPIVVGYGEWTPLTVAALIAYVLLIVLAIIAIALLIRRITMRS